MIYCANLNAFKSDAQHPHGEIELKSVDESTGVKGQVITVQKSFKTPGGAKILESETPFGHTGMYLQIMPMSTEEFTGSGDVTFYLYDEDPSGPEPSECSNLVGTYGPFVKKDFDDAVKRGKLLVETHVGVKTRGRIQLKVKAGGASAFSKGRVYARFAPNNG